jgi:hypothetical protein
MTHEETQAGDKPVMPDLPQMQHENEMQSRKDIREAS